MKAFKIFLTTFFNLVLFSLLNGIGELKVWYGPMLSGKSGAALGYAEGERKKGFAVKPTKATRDGAKIVSHTKPPKEMEAIFLDDTEDGFEEAAAQLFKTIKEKEITVVIFDEFQFFPLKVIDFVFCLLITDINVGIASLDLNFLGQPFGTATELLIKGLRELDYKFAEKLTAICEECKRHGNPNVPAQYSQMIDKGRNDEPITSGDVVAINADYEPRCKRCFVRAS